MTELIDRQSAIDAIVEASKVWETGEPFDEGMKAAYAYAVTILLSLPARSYMPIEKEVSE